MLRSAQRLNERERKINLKYGKKSIFEQFRN